ncbi:MAG: hypothetical protein Q4B16_01250 [Bacteroidia bacterium]|nr:hypothetical protein [Bacteroidia bacterium]
MRHLPAILLSVLTLLQACTRPAVTERFILREDCVQEGIYTFEVDMSDSAACYDISLYTRLDGNHQRPDAPEGVTLRMVWTSPSGGDYSENVYFSFAESSREDGFFSLQCLLPYRSGLIPVERGLWTLTLGQTEPVRDLRGWGIICKREEL